MAGWRKRSKSGGITRTSTDKGWTTSTSQGAGKKNGLGYRVTTTHRADGKTVVRTTERNNGWHKTTQRTLSSKDPYKPTKKDFDKLAGDGSGTGYVLLFFFCVWAIVEIIGWVRRQLQPIFNFFNTHNIADIIIVLTVCAVGSWIFLKIIIRFWNKWFN